MRRLQRCATPSIVLNVCTVQRIAIKREASHLGRRRKIAHRSGKADALSAILACVYYTRCKRSVTTLLTPEFPGSIASELLSELQPITEPLDGKSLSSLRPYSIAHTLERSSRSPLFRPVHV